MTILILLRSLCLCINMLTFNSREFSSEHEPGAHSPHGKSETTKRKKSTLFTVSCLYNVYIYRLYLDFNIHVIIMYHISPK